MYADPGKHLDGLRIALTAYELEEYMCKLTRNAACAVLALGGLLSSCAGDTDLGVQHLAANVAKSQLRGYDLGPPFPAGLRDSGLINGYGEGEWIPFVAIMEGSKLEDADINQGSAGDGQYRAAIILPTYSERNNANGLIDLATTGTYGQQPVAPIPAGFDNGWLVENGYDPFVLGAFSDTGEHDAAPVILGAAQRTGPTRFGGNVSSVSVSVSWQLANPADNVELRFAVYMAPPGLEPVVPGGAPFASRTPGGALGACSFHPGPGPLFVGYEVDDPTGIATVPIRCRTTTCSGDEECTPGETCNLGTGECDHPCVSDATCPTDQVCEDGVCTETPPTCIDDEDCAGWYCVGGFCTPECPTECETDVEFCGDMERCVPPGGENPPCTTDAQCPGGELCEDGHCAPPTPPCDMTCPSGDQCVDGVCVPPETPCTDDGQCPGGELCVDGSCTTGEPPCPDGTCPTCVTDTDCDGGDLCVGGVCIPSNPPEACTSVGDCDAGELCEAGFCTPPPGDCGTGGTCPAGELCENPGGPGNCIPEHPPVPCVTVSDCPSGDLCLGGFCTPPGGDVHPPIACDDSADCPTGDLCAGGFCIPPDGAVHPPIGCTDASSCPSGDLCTGGFCTPPGDSSNPEGPCVESSDCEFAYCVSEECIPPHAPVPCDNVADCPGGDLCTGGFCLPPTWEPPGTGGGADGGGWGSTCVTSSDCEFSFCIDEECVPPHPPVSCDNVGDCPSGDACSGGFCVPPGGSGTACTGEAQCDALHDCVGGVCTPSPGEDCVESSDCEFGFCVDQQCETSHPPIPCASESECPSGDACIEGWCWGAAPCTDDTDCPGGTTCEAGFCRPGDEPESCAVSSECPVCSGSDDVCVAVVCEEGFCRPAAGGDDASGGTCTGAGDCPGGWNCTGGFCVPSTGGGHGGCSSDAGCPGGYGCESGYCVDLTPPTSCASLFDCAGGSLCDGGYCQVGDGAETCDTGDDCVSTSSSDDVGGACIGGVCEGGGGSSTGPCTTDGDCSPGEMCVVDVDTGSGTCTRVEGLCELDGDCTGGQACLSGWCGTPCADSSACGGGVCVEGRCGSSCSTYSQCGSFEACLGGGCVPWYSSVGGSGGSQTSWQVEIPGNDTTLGGGCSTAPGRAPLGGLALLLLVLGVPSLFVIRIRSKRS
jgi:hypothetical protein